MGRLVFLGLLLASCVNVEWRRGHGFAAPAPEAFEALEPDRSQLGKCLELLGAPLLVWQEPGGAALAWGWYEEGTLGGGLSVPVAEAFSASFDARDIDADMRGLMLFFDEGWTLRIVRRGPLRELATYGRQLTLPPDLLEEEQGSAARPGRG